MKREIDRPASLQPMLPLTQPAIPHQDLTAAYLPTLGGLNSRELISDSTGKLLVPP